MAQITIYKAIPLTQDYYKLFNGVYNNFREDSKKDYKFELEPLIFEEFIECVENHILECIILLEDKIPTGFLIYTEAANSAIELNIIYCLGSDDINAKKKILVEKFLAQVSNNIGHKIISYPMIGKQADFTKFITKYNFKLLGQAVVKFLTNNEAHSVDILYKTDLPYMEEGYALTNYKPEYFDEITRVIHEAFSTASDAETDDRFRTISGCKNILEKITENVYGDFLKESSTVLLFNGTPVGICLSNLTSDSIANIPLVGLKKEHQSKGLSEQMIKRSLCVLLQEINEKRLNVQEINATLDTANYPAVKMYRKLGFKEDYNYIHAYIPVSR